MLPAAWFEPVFNSAPVGSDLLSPRPGLGLPRTLQALPAAGGQTAAQDLPKTP